MKRIISLVFIQLFLVVSCSSSSPSSSSSSSSASSYVESSSSSSASSYVESSSESVSLVKNINDVIKGLMITNFTYTYTTKNGINHKFKGYVAENFYKETYTSENNSLGNTATYIYTINDDGVKIVDQGFLINGSLSWEKDKFNVDYLFSNLTNEVFSEEIAKSDVAIIDEGQYYIESITMHLDAKKGEYYFFHDFLDIINDNIEIKYEDIYINYENGSLNQITLRKPIISYRIKEGNKAEFYVSDANYDFIYTFQDIGNTKSQEIKKLKNGKSIEDLKNSKDKHYRPLFSYPVFNKGYSKSVDENNLYTTISCHQGGIYLHLYSDKRYEGMMQSKISGEKYTEKKDSIIAYYTFQKINDSIIAVKIGGGSGGGDDGGSMKYSTMLALALSDFDQKNYK